MKIKFNFLLFIAGMILLTLPAAGQTFWGMTSRGSTFQGGTIFSYNVQTNSCKKEFEFKPNPVYDAINIFEESPDVYIGICQKSWADSLTKKQNGNALYRYYALKDSTEIVAELPYYFKHWNGDFKPGEADIIYFQGNIIGMMRYGEDTMKLVSYSVAEKNLKEISVYSSNSWPGDGNYSYDVSGCYFTAVNDTTVLFSLGKFKQVGRDGILGQGRDFFSYNPQTGHVGILFNIPDSIRVYLYGPFTQTQNGRLLCPASKNILEVHLADSTYSFLTPFGSGYFVKGKMMPATDSTLVGLYSNGDSRLFEYDFKNDTLLADYPLGRKSRFYNMVEKNGTLYFSLVYGDNWPEILSYQPGGAAPVKIFEQSEYDQNRIQYITENSDNGTLLVMSYGVSNYYIQKNAYIDKVRFGYSGSGRYSYKNGAMPEADLLPASDGKLYGIAPDGGKGSYTHGDGTLFEIDPKTKEFRVLVNFTGKNGGFGDRDSYGTYYGKGQNNLIEVNRKIYGTTYTNGDYDRHLGPGYGTVFTYDISRNYDNFRKIYDFNVDDTAGNGRFPMSGLTLAANGKLYGTTFSGGTGINGRGVLYEIDPAQNDTFRVVLRIPDTCLPPGDNLVAAGNGKMYGLATSIDRPLHEDRKWAIREYDVVHGTFSDIYRSAAKYEQNYSQFVYHNNKLYGVVTRGGNDNKGYLFEFDLTTRKLAQRVIFPLDGSKGKYPKGNLTLSSTGTLWGFTTDRMIYEYNPADTSLTGHYRFAEYIGSDPLYSCLTEVEGDHTSIGKNKRFASIKAFPNPAVDNVKFVFEDNSLRHVQYAVYDVSGRRVLQGTAQVSGYVFINFSGFKPGVYVVNMQAGNSTYSKKIIKK